MFRYLLAWQAYHRQQFYGGRKLYDPLENLPNEKLLPQTYE